MTANTFLFWLFSFFWNGHLGDWEMAQLVKCLPHNHALELRSPVPTQKLGTRSWIYKFSTGRAGDRWIPRTHWSISLATVMSSGFSERSCLKKYGEEWPRKTCSVGPCLLQGLTFMHVHLQRCVDTYKQVYIANKCVCTHISRIYFQKITWGSDEMAQWVKPLLCKSDELSSNHGTYLRQVRTCPMKFSSDLHMHTMECVPIPHHTRVYIHTSPYTNNK